MKVFPIQILHQYCSILLNAVMLFYCSGFQPVVRVPLGVRQLLPGGGTREKVETVFL